jgi:chloramphenicol-sensitive protein RarD
MNAGEQGRGTALAYALGAHLFWGLMPVYLLLLQNVPSLEFVAWRLVFTLPLCLAIIAIFADFSDLKRVLRNGKIMLTLMASSAIIATNWFLYIFSIQNGYVYAASLGYYILPLTMMLLGLVFLKERLTRLQWAAVVLATIGVTALAIGALTTMWLSLSMAISFGVYGLLRKTVDAGPLTGLTVEAMILMPLALGAIGWFWQSPEGMAFGQSWTVSLALAASGPITAAPMMMFAAAARRLPYTVIGFLQFTSPTIVFLLGLFVFGEELKPAQLACFVMIWAAAALFTWSLFRGADPAPADEITSRGAGH